MNRIVPIILAGGGGTRLWPLSRKLYPKQFLALNGDDSMLQLTLKRLDGFRDEAFELAPPLVVCNEEHRFLVAEHARVAGVPLSGIVLEPEGRNTAPALTVANLILKQRLGDVIGLMMPADHLIGDTTAFHQALTSAARAAKEGYLATFGVVPTTPETGYGYIHFGDAIEISPGNNAAAPACHTLNRFVEKPDLETAERYLAEGGYLWNSGMFVIGADTWLDAVGAFAPEMLSACTASVKAMSADGDFIRVGKAEFAACPSDSIDYAVMEHVGRAAGNGSAGSPKFQGAVVPLSAKWSDIGAWSSVWEVSPRDENENALIGDAHVVDGRNNLVVADGRFVGAVGVDNMVIVETADAILVAPRERAQEVKKLVEWLGDAGREEQNLHRRVYRPWGSYEGVDSGDRFQVKRIIVKPGEKLSLQMHHHRAEHWIVVCGTAKVTRGDEEYMVAENESTFIPLGVTHRLENPGKIPLELIEVQSGAYLGEDDIVRIEDQYQRV